MAEKIAGGKRGRLPSKAMPMYSKGPSSYGSALGAPSYKHLGIAPPDITGGGHGYHGADNTSIRKKKAAPTKKSAGTTERGRDRGRGLGPQIKAY